MPKAAAAAKDKSMHHLKNLDDLATEANLLSPALTDFYGGPLGFPESSPDAPYIYANFVHSLDGRITLDEPGHIGGGEISMFNTEDRMLMAVLRTLAGGVLMGANTLRLEPDHIWTADYLLSDQPEFRVACGKLRHDLGLPAKMRHFFLTGSGNVYTPGEKLPAVFGSDAAEIVFLTSKRGAEQLRHDLPKGTSCQAAIFGEKDVDPKAAMKYLRELGVKHLLCEGGPTVIGNLFDHRLLGEVFLTEAPHVVGDRFAADRPDRKTWVAGHFGRHLQTNQAELLSVKRAGHHLFKRYRFV